MRENPEIRVRERHNRGHLRYQGSGRQVGLVPAWMDLPPEKSGHSCQTCWGKGRNMHMRSHIGGSRGARSLEALQVTWWHTPSQLPRRQLSQEEKNFPGALSSLVSGKCVLSDPCVVRRQESQQQGCIPWGQHTQCTVNELLTCCPQIYYSVVLTIFI